MCSCPNPLCKATINAAFDARNTITLETKGEVRDAVDEALNLLDSGSVRVAEKQSDTWVVNQ